MEFDLSKVIYYKNKEKAKIGKEYYFLNCLDEDYLSDPKYYLQGSRDVLAEVGGGKTLCFRVLDLGWVGTFLYPIE